MHKQARISNQTQINKQNGYRSTSTTSVTALNAKDESCLHSLLIHLQLMSTMIVSLIVARICLNCNEILRRCITSILYYGSILDNWILFELDQSTVAAANIQCKCARNSIQTKINGMSHSVFGRMWLLDQVFSIMHILI